LTQSHIYITTKQYIYIATSYHGLWYYMPKNIQVGDEVWRTLDTMRFVTKRTTSELLGEALELLRTKHPEYVDVSTRSF